MPSFVYRGRVGKCVLFDGLWIPSRAREVRSESIVLCSSLLTRCVPASCVERCGGKSLFPARASFVRRWTERAIALESAQARLKMPMDPSVAKATSSKRIFP